MARPHAFAVLRLTIRFNLLGFASGFLPVPDANPELVNESSAEPARRTSSASSSDGSVGYPCFMPNPYTNELDAPPAIRFPAEKVFF